MPCIWFWIKLDLRLCSESQSRNLPDLFSYFFTFIPPTCLPFFLWAKGNLAMSGDIFDGNRRLRGGVGNRQCYWHPEVMVREATKHSTMYRSDPNKELCNSNVNSAVVNKPCNKHKCVSLCSGYWPFLVYLKQRASSIIHRKANSREETDQPKIFLTWVWKCWLVIPIIKLTHQELHRRLYENFILR